MVINVRLILSVGGRDRGDGGISTFVASGELGYEKVFRTERSTSTNSNG